MPCPIRSTAPRKLTGQLLAFARRQALKPEVFEVGERLRAVSEMIDTVTGARIRLTVETPDEPCFVKADLSQFETALINMAVNARDAMDGEGTLTLDSGAPRKAAADPGACGRPRSLRGDLPHRYGHRNRA